VAKPTLFSLLDVCVTCCHSALLGQIPFFTLLLPYHRRWYGLFIGIYHYWKI